MKTVTLIEGDGIGPEISAATVRAIETLAPQGRLRAVLPVHIFGYPADIPAFERLGLPIVEDACEALGAVHADGTPVGAARAFVEDGLPAVILISGGVLAAARGHGAYRALVRARWDDAVQGGQPALVVHAGAMSRPILERLGFQAVAEQEVLLDPTTC